MEVDYDGEWYPRDHGISGTGQWLGEQKELEYAPAGVSLVRHRTESNR